LSKYSKRHTEDVVPDEAVEEQHRVRECQRTTGAMQFEAIAAQVPVFRVLAAG
jgi:hypothetical protein